MKRTEHHKVPFQEKFEAGNEVADFISEFKTKWEKSLGKNFHESWERFVDNLTESSVNDYKSVAGAVEFDVVAGGFGVSQESVFDAVEDEVEDEGRVAAETGENVEVWVVVDLGHEGTLGFGWGGLVGLGDGRKDQEEQKKMVFNVHSELL